MALIFTCAFAGLCERKFYTMKKKSKFFLTYSIALFSFALILILFSAFTGIRYKMGTESTKVLYDGAKSNIISLTNENELLTRQNSEKEKMVADLLQKNQELSKEIEQHNFAIEQSEKLMQVQLFLRSKRYTDAKNLFDTIDPSALGGSGKDLYEQIRKNF